MVSWDWFLVEPVLSDDSNDDFGILQYRDEVLESFDAGPHEWGVDLSMSAAYPYSYYQATPVLVQHWYWNTDGDQIELRHFGFLLKEIMKKYFNLDKIG